MQICEKSIETANTDVDFYHLFGKIAQIISVLEAHFSYFDSDSSLIAKVVSSRGVIILIFWLYSRVKVVLVSQQIQLVTFYAACHISITLLSQMKHFQRHKKDRFTLKNKNNKKFQF